MTTSKYLICKMIHSLLARQLAASRSEKVNIWWSLVTLCKSQCSGPIYCIFCQWLATGRWFSPGTRIPSTNKTYHHDITEILLKVALTTIVITTNPFFLITGLWIADLSITQLFLQSVKEKERGLVSGVQNSLNQLMDMLKALMVILAPYPEEFGLLIVISFGFVCTGCLLYIKFLCSNRNVSYG
jgi:hypothetical protein